MSPDSTCLGPRLMDAGRWDDALSVLAAEAAGARAQVLVDRFWWRTDGQAEAEQAVAAPAEEDGPVAAFLDARLACTRLLFDLSPHPDDLDRARDGFESAAQHPARADWGSLWRG